MSRATSSRNRGPIVRTREIWSSRATLWLLVKRDLKVRYADSLLGYVWSVLDPLVMSLIYFFVFTFIFQRKVGGEPYIIFLLVALLPWLWFNTGVTDGLKAISNQAPLVRSTAVPRELWVLRTVVAKGIEFMLSVPVLVIFALIYINQMHVNSMLWLFPVAILLQFILLMGLGFLLAPLMVLLKDVEPIVRLALRFLMYASPVIYGINDVIGSSLPQVIKWLYILNPMSGILSAYRAGIYSTEFNGEAIITAAVICLATFAVGWWVFARTEKTVLKEM